MWKRCFSISWERWVEACRGKRVGVSSGASARASHRVSRTVFLVPSGAFGFAFLSGPVLG